MSHSIPHITLADVADQDLDQDVDTYSDILSKHHVEFRRIGYNLQVGVLRPVSGWILHISVVRWQLRKLLETILPTLREKNIVFRVVQDKETARNVLDGGLGHYQIGKVLTVFPNNDTAALELASLLIPMTEKFKGPEVLTDMHLGGNIYTRYGAFQSITRPNEDGTTSKYRYEADGSLVKDEYSIPFILPSNTIWPFDDIKKYSPAQKRSTLGYKYKPIYKLKEDPKGNVYKGVYLRKLFLPAPCVIKQGKKNMWSDEGDRDMISRLLWQKQIHDRLEKAVPLPKIINFYSDGTDAYLIMQYIHGPNLLEKVYQINSNCDIWANLALQDKKKIFYYLMQVISILTRLHENELVHRDFTPVNFLVPKNNHLVLIDNELVYDLDQKTPTPAFEAGTRGFMSPQQAGFHTPTQKDDIYALGALMISIFTGLSPITIGLINEERAFQFLQLCIDNTELTTLIMHAVKSNPEKRPTLEKIHTVLSGYQKKLNITPHIANSSISTLQLQSLNNIIAQAIQGLINEPTIFYNGLWYSRSSIGGTDSKAESAEFSKLTGLFDGMSGILYFLAKAHYTGYDISDCQSAFTKSWKFIENNCSTSQDLSAGMYGGSAGIALSLAWSVKAGLVPDTPSVRSLVHNYLSLDTPFLDVAAGLSGKGLAAIQCLNLMTGQQLDLLLSSFRDEIIRQADEKGWWVYVQEASGTRHPATSFSHGNTGIIYFLLESLLHQKDQTCLDKVKISMKSCEEEVKKIKKVIAKKGIRSLLNEDPYIFDGMQGLILVFIKAYQILGHPRYKDYAEILLRSFPGSIVHSNFSQYTGLAGIGDLYLKAYNVFNNEEWKKRAHWLAYFFSKVCQDGSGDSVYWLGNSNFSTAEFMTGNSGIIYFLMNFAQEGNFGYRFID